MRKTIAIVSLFVIMFASVGCATSGSANVFGVKAGVHASAHAWENPSFKSDFTGNPISSEVVLGLVTVGSDAGLEVQDNWVDVSVKAGPK